MAVKKLPKKKSSHKKKTKTSKSTAKKKSKKPVTSKRKTRTQAKKINEAKTERKKVTRALHRYKRVLIILSVFMILLIALLGFANFKVKLLFDNEATLHITPSVSSISVINGEEAQKEMRVEFDEVNICEYSCKRMVKDLSQGIQVYNEQVSNKGFTEEITFPVPQTGEGQTIFNYEVICTAQKGKLCPVEGKEYKATAFLTVNRALSPNEEELKTELEPKIQEQVRNIAHLKEQLYVSNKLNTKLMNITNEEIQKQEISSLELTTERLQNKTTQVLNLWEQEQFLATRDLLTNLTLEQTTINKTIQKISTELKQLQNKYNKAINILTNINISSLEQEAGILQTRDQQAFTELMTFIAAYENMLNDSINLQTISEQSINLYQTYDNIEEEIEQYKEIIEVEKENWLTLINNDILNQENTTINVTGCEGLRLGREKLSQFNSSINLSTNITLLETFISTNCVAPTIKLSNITIPQQITSENITIQLQEIPVPTAQCCYQNKCLACSSQTNTPIVLVHGHSFMKSQSPELAFTRLQFLQEKLAEDGYVNAGRIGEGFDVDNIPSGDWGRSPAPAVVSMTYYYLNTYYIGDLHIVTRKTDNIENYAIRLKESVDLVRKKTGSDQVILIAHSMGGLVSREYLRLFGDQDIKALIILGTPNKGVEGDVKKFCTVTGAAQECEDMYADSIFLRKLNAPGSEPKNAEVFTVGALGCIMKSDTSKNEQGDGVVLARSVPLPYATNYNITGECTDFLGTDLHMNFVNPNLYPETYEIIKEILGEIEN